MIIYVKINDAIRFFLYISRWNKNIQVFFRVSHCSRENFKITMYKNSLYLTRALATSHYILNMSTTLSLFYYHKKKE